MPSEQRLAGGEDMIDLEITAAVVLVLALPQDPLSVEFAVAPLDRRPGYTVCNFLQAHGFSRSVTVPSAVEGCAKNVLGMRGQVQPD